MAKPAPRRPFSADVASRLEALNGRYGTTILATAEVVEQAGEGFAWRRIDRLAVKGKELPVDVFDPDPKMVPCTGYRLSVSIY